MTDGIVSIIIPVYNVTDYVVECLESVAAQNYYAIEVLVVDDCGTDDSMTKVRRFVSNYNGSISFRLLRHSQNRGLSAARNTGIEEAIGDYILFLDSDDYILPDSIRILVDAFKDNGNPDWVQGDILSNSGLVSDPLKGGEVSREHLALKYRGMYKTAWNKMYRTAFLRDNQLRFIEGLLHEDMVWYFQLLCCTKKAVETCIPTYFYRVNQSGITKRSFESRYSHICRGYVEMINYARNTCHWNDRVVFSYLIKYIKEVYSLPTWEGVPSLSGDFFRILRQTPFWSFRDIWKLSKSWKVMIIHLHRLMPSRIGAVYFKFMLGKFFV